MCKSNVIAAIIVSSLTFGIGHIVNIFMGAPVFDTLLQLLYASAIGFCYTVVFHKGGSIIPCIISHAIVNSMSIFAIEAADNVQLIVALVQTAISIIYGVWILLKNKDIVIKSN